jgi:AcrR family transcriptional regulator
MMGGATEVREARHGRPRDPHVDSAIKQAALDLLVEEGFARMSMEGVANRAGVGKAAIYRRWDSKTALVVDAIHDVVSPHLDWPSTTDIRADLEVIFRQSLAKMRGTEGGLMAAVVGELVRNPELAATVRGQFVGCRKEDLVDRIQEAIDSGELPPGDAGLLAEVGFAIIHHRMLLTDAPLTDDLPKRLVEQFFPRVPE